MNAPVMITIAVLLKIRDVGMNFHQTGTHVNVKMDILEITVKVRRYDINLIILLDHIMLMSIK
jgi:hypothetical protein